MAALQWLMASLILALLAIGCADHSETSRTKDLPGKQIALSFDDIPRHAGELFSEDERTQRLITALSRTNVEQVVFFVNPGRLADRPGGEARIEAYVAAGHLIANHTFDHPRLRTTDVEDYVAEIDATEQWLKGRPGYRPWFRFPFLDEGGADTIKRDAIRNALAARGLRNGYVTIDASDWFYEQAFSNAKRDGHNVDMNALRELFIESHVAAANAYDAIAKKALGRSPAHMLLLHESDLVALFIEDLVLALRKDGWTIIAADEAYKDPIGELRPDVPSAQGTLTEMIAWKRGLPTPRWYKRNDTVIAQREFDRRVLGLGGGSDDETD